MPDFAGRRAKLRRQIAKQGLDAIVISLDRNVTYLTGFSGDSTFLVLGKKLEVAVSDSRYTIQLEQECPGLQTHIPTKRVSVVEGASQVLTSGGFSKVGAESDHLTHAQFGKLAELLPQATLVPTQELVESQRVIKDKEEIAEIREAVSLAQRSFDILRASLHPDQTELQIAAELEYTIRKLGGAGCAFDPIIAVGERSALPHAPCTNKKVGEAPFLLVDWGATARQYRCDLTRVLPTGKIPPKLERIYRVVFTAQERAIAAIRPGAVTGDVDAQARGTIAEAGFGKFFGHGLGHGFGLQIHEAPGLRAKATQTLEPGMVVTVEPGIYIPGFGGVRLEDDVLVTKDGHELLTSVPKEWEQVKAGSPAW